MSEKEINESKVVAQASLVSIVGNVILSGFKLVAGLLGKSGAMVSDAVHSLSDVFSTFIALFGVHLSKKVPDKEHPYGHERLECVASIVLALLLIITGFGIGYNGIVSIINSSTKPPQTPHLIALIAAVVSIVVKEGMFWYTRYCAKKINSSAFMADAWHHRSDALSSIGALIGIAGARLGYPVLDSVASIVICFFIFHVSIKIFKDAISKMLDSSCSEEMENELSQFISEQAGVGSIDLLHTRTFGERIYVDLEIGIDKNKSLEEAHEIAEQVHLAVEEKYPDIKHIMIHMNPVDVSNY